MCDEQADLAETWDSHRHRRPPRSYDTIQVVRMVGENRTSGPKLPDVSNWYGQDVCETTFPFYFCCRFFKSVSAARHVLSSCYSRSTDDFAIILHVQTWYALQPWTPGCNVRPTKHETPYFQS